ncbi:MAG: Flp pilus assembly complex ATPase component TadA, partial [Acidobacteriia bacterium]|nr:Flp pilus assembly complex ATPase component TadA [Terriglobia bacterium]
MAIYVSSASPESGVPETRLPHQRLGEILIERHKIEPEDLERALELQQERGDKLGKILADMGLVAQRDVLAALSYQLDLPLVTLDGPPPAAPELEGLSERFLRQCRAFPIALVDSTLTLAMADPLDFETIAAVRAFSGFEVLTALAAEQEIADAIDKHYGESERQTLLTEGDDEQATADLEHLRDMASEAPVIRLVNAMIAEAVEKRASDIHIEPFEKEFRVRFRVDGVLFNQETPPRELKAAIISRLKLMAKLNIAERRLPQDGRIKLKILGREVDLRVSTLPTLYGESVVMRLLDRSAGDFYDLRRLGFDDRMLARMEHFTSLPHGIFLVTGPTGSGKSTTLYSALKQINQPDRKIITIEDPVEYQMDGINQIHVNPQIGLTFAAGLRHIVRQDPDVIMVGEIRDRETADIAIRAALTGHLVFSTLHTNDAPSAIQRLTDMGVETYLITSSLVAVLAQRLVRVICRNCKESAGPTLAPDGELVETFRGAGCDECAGTGYNSRVGIFELMEMNDEMRRRVMANEDAALLTQAARRNGMRNLR